MCGLCGVAYRDGQRVADDPLLLRMRDSMVHRGPDDAGVHRAPGIAMGSRRLAILDLSQRGHMPMATNDERYWIVYNGEVYNYRELRRDLESRGVRLRSNTDTEVILHLYRDEGPRILDRLNGMFALAIWDAGERSLFLARDRLGVKPLYYAVRPEGLYFASEEKALFAAGVPASFDPHVWDELLCFRYVAGDSTPFTGVRRLLPGHHLVWREGALQITRWWNLAERARALRDDPLPDPAEWFRETFDDAVRLRNISDVPVGVLLSGGVDSGSVAASLALQVDRAVETFTVRFAEPGYDEGPLAQALARRYALAYNELSVPDDALEERVRQASWFNDEPLAHGNDVHLLAISEFAKPRVTVLLSGEGADETLGGYVRYRPLSHPRMLALARPLWPRIASTLGLRGRARKLAAMLRTGSLDRLVLFNACDLFPADLDGLARPIRTDFAFRESVLVEAQSLYPGDHVRQAMYSDQHTFLCSVLDRNDRTTMAASIECRVPFLDFRLVERLAALPTPALVSARGGKRLLRDALGARLPEEIRRHRKWGFGVPWTTYCRRVPELRSLVTRLHRLPLLEQVPFVPARLEETTRRFLAGDDAPAALIGQLVLVALWHDTYFAKLDAIAALSNDAAERHRLPG